MEIRPITDLRKTQEISELCHTSKEPVFITKNGYGDMVIMSIEKYKQMFEELELEKAVLEAERDMKNGAKIVEAEQVFERLDKKYDL